MVPVDVRVVDRDGKAVTDLEQEDFTILEDGVPQPIGHFSIQAFRPDMAAVARPLRNVDTPNLEAQDRRVFLFQLGRGRLNGPSKELPALLDFVGKRLLPQDRVAVLAYNRATPFTTNHAKVIAVIERFRDRHEGIETSFEEYFSGLRAQYGSPDIPPFIQTQIDGIFEGVSGLRPHSVKAPARVIDEPRHDDSVDEIMPFDAYVDDQVERPWDTLSLYIGINYLRHLEGEKHLVFLTPRTHAMGRLEHSRSMARSASNARVAVDIIYTGGVVGPPPPRFAGIRSEHPSAIIMSPVPTSAAVWSMIFGVKSMRQMSELTGGQASAFRKADEAFDRLDETTRVHYLLGYYPSNLTLDGKLRTITVKAERRGATAIHRQSYYATQQAVPIDRRQFITDLRMTEAGDYPGVLRDIEVTLKPPRITGRGAAREVIVDINVKSERIKFLEEAGRYLAELDIGIYCTDARREPVCDSVQRMNLNFPAERYQRFPVEGVSHTARVPLTGYPVYFRIIVYDYAADVIGAAVHRLR
jgi:VWFA-related protein